MKQLKIDKQIIIDSIKQYDVNSIIYSYECKHNCIDCIFLYDNGNITCGGNSTDFDFLTIKEWLSSCFSNLSHPNYCHITVHIHPE